MTLVRERRRRRALRLTLPPQVPLTNFQRRTQLPSPDSPGIVCLSELEKLAVLGHGNGSTVYQVRHRRTSTEYALKVIRFGSDSVALRDQAAREAAILQRIDSEFVVKCLGVFAGDGDGDGHLSFVLEFMAAGSLQDALWQQHQLPEPAIAAMARRVLEGLNYLHGMKIVHGDIKPSNLLINHKGEIKIADFGTSQILDDRVDHTDSYSGTYAYMSPERFDSEKWNGGFSNGFAADVWSLGVVALECHVGRFPLIGSGQRPDWATLMCAVCFGEKVELPAGMSPEFRSFVWRCLEKDWKKRGTVSELLSHPFATNCFDSSFSELDGCAM
ncbi:Mitogen-activated protein kinase kinase [Bertholletia excelsa]